MNYRMTLVMPGKVMVYIYIYIYKERKTDRQTKLEPQTCIQTTDLQSIYIYPKKLQFAAYGQFLLVTYNVKYMQNIF